MEYLFQLPLCSERTKMYRIKREQLGIEKSAYIFQQSLSHFHSRLPYAQGIGD